MWTENDIPDLTGTVAVVTGANGGLGLATTEALTAKGAHVVMAARNQTKAQAARGRILAANPEASLELVELDLASQASVKKAASHIAGSHGTINLLVNNAGLMATPEQQTEDGHELQFGVNHLGHWTFTAGLLPNLIGTYRARVVTVTSIARLQGRPVDPDNVNLERDYDPWAAYGRAKLANFHFGLGLHDRLRRAGASTLSLVAHPGLSNTDLQSTTVEHGGGGALGPFFDRLTERIGMSPKVGARSQLRAATDPEARSGQLYGPLFASTGPAVARPVLSHDQDAIAALWAISEAATGVDVDPEAVRAAIDG